MNPLPAAVEAPPAKPADAVEVGRIVGSWGVKGAIKVKPLSADPQALFSTKRWFVEPSDAKPGHQVPPVLRVVQARGQGDVVVASVHDVADRDAAQALSGARVFVARSSFPTPDDDEFYWVDLIGLTVRNTGERVLGRVVGLLETGPHCVLRIRPEAAGNGAAEPAEVLIPFVAAYVGKVDLAARTIDVDWGSDY